MEIIFATSNHGKALEAAKVLEKFNVKVKHKKMSIIELDLAAAGWCARCGG